MEGIVITDVGIEFAVILELKEKLNITGKIEDSVVIFKAKNYDDICKFTSSTQASKRVLMLIGKYSLNNFDCVCKDSSTIFKKFSYKDWFNEKTTFRIVCERIGEHDFTSRDVEEEIGGYVLDNVEKQLGFKPKVSLKKPDVVFYSYIYDNSGYIGIDFAGKDLSKRDYKLYSPPGSVRGNIAYALIRFSDYTKSKTLVDPFAVEALIPIESVFFALNKKVTDKFAFSKFKHIDFKPEDESTDDNLKLYSISDLHRKVKYGQNNAKVAGVEEKIKFSKSNVEYLDTVLSEKSVDMIVTHPPQVSKNMKKEIVKKIYDEFFYQAKIALTDKGRIVALLMKVDLFVEYAKKHGFKLKEKKEIKTGGLENHMVKLVKR